MVAGACTFRKNGASFEGPKAPGPPHTIPKCLICKITALYSYGESLLFLAREDLDGQLDVALRDLHGVRDRDLVGEPHRVQ